MDTRDVVCTRHFNTQWLIRTPGDMYLAALYKLYYGWEKDRV